MAEAAYIYDPEDRKVYEIDEIDLAAELRGGALPASGEQIQAFKTRRLLNEKYGTTGQQALGTLEEIAGTLTFGGSRLAERALGVPEEGLRERAERVSPLVTAGATIAPAVLTGGGSALAQGFARGTARALGREVAEEAVEAGARGLASRLAGATAPGAIFSVEQGIARGIAPAGSSLGRRALGQAVGSAVGGAAVTTGELVNEAAVGEPLELGEDVLPRIGLGALFGAAAGGAFELGGGVVSAAARKGRDAIARVWKTVVDKYPEHAKRVLPGEYAPVVDDLMATRHESVRGPAWVKDAVERHRPRFEGEKLPDLPPAYERQEIPEDLVFRKGPRPERPAPREITDVDVADFSDAITAAVRDVDDAANKLFKSAGVDEAGDALPGFRQAERDAFGDEALINRAAAVEQTTSLLRQGDELLSEIAEQPTLYGTGTIRAFKEALETAQKRLLDAGKEPTGLQMFQALDDLRRGISDRDLWKTREILDYSKGIQRALKEPDVWNQLAVRQRQVNAAYTRLTSNLTGTKAARDATFRKFFLAKKSGGDAASAWVADPDKIRRFLKNLGKPGNALKERVFAEFNASAAKFLDEVEESARHLPGRFERSTVEAALERNRENLSVAQAAAQERAALNEERRAFNEALRAAKDDDAARKEVLSRARQDFQAEQRAKAREAKEARAAVREERKELKRLNDANRKAHDAEVREEMRVLQGTGGSLPGGLGFGVGLGIGVHPIIGIPYAAMRLRSYLSAPARAIRTMTVLEESAKRTAESIERLSRAVASGARTPYHATALGAVASYAKNAQRDRKWFDKRIKDLRRLGSDPDLLADRLDALTEGLAHAAPHTAAAAQQTAVRYVTYMNASIPPEPDMGPLGGKWVTPQSDVAAFLRLDEVAQGGVVTLLELAREGSVLPAHVDAIRSIYPEQYARMVVGLLDYASTRELSGATLQTIRTLLGEPVTATQHPATVAAVQQAYADAAMGQGVPQSHKDMTVDLSARLRTPVSADGPVGERDA